MNMCSGLYTVCDTLSPGQSCNLFLVPGSSLIPRVLLWLYLPGAATLVLKTFWRVAARNLHTCCASGGAEVTALLPFLVNALPMQQVNISSKIVGNRVTNS